MPEKQQPITVLPIKLFWGTQYWSLELESGHGYSGAESTAK